MIEFFFLWAWLKCYYATFVASHSCTTLILLSKQCRIKIELEECLKTKKTTYT